MRSLTIFTILFLFGTAFCYYWGQGNPNDRVLLSSVNALTFYRSKYTTGRRSRPIAQMKCLGGSAGCKYMPSSMQCYNKGSDGRDVQWECKAELENGVSLGETTVSCEGYDYPDDPYILAGSCGVEFYLNKNSDFYNYKHNNHYYNSYNSYNSYPYSWYNPIGWFYSFFDNLGKLIFCFVVIVFVIGLVGLNTIFKFIWMLFKVIFFPLYLFSCCCCRGPSGPAYATYIPPPPPVFHNPWGNGFAMYEQGRRQGYQEAARDYHNTYYYDNSSSNNNDTHTSTSYASTSRR